LTLVPAVHALADSETISGYCPAAGVEQLGATQVEPSAYAGTIEDDLAPAGEATTAEHAVLNLELAGVQRPATVTFPGSFVRVFQYSSVKVQLTADIGAENAQLSVDTEPFPAQHGTLDGHSPGLQCHGPLD
jgi:hypothetical protein